MAEDETPQDPPETPPTSPPEPSDQTAALLAQIEAKDAELAAAQEQINALAFSPVTEEGLQVSLEQAQAELKELRSAQSATSGAVQDIQRENRRLKLLQNHPELVGHEHLITSDDPAEMEKQAQAVLNFAEAFVNKTRPKIEAEITERFGPTLSTPTGHRASLNADQLKDREAAIERGDSEEVAQQIVEANLDKMLAG